MNFLPENLLPKWILLIGITATIMAIQSYFKVEAVKLVYGKGKLQVTPLTSRLFSLWNLTSAIIRISSAYNLKNSILYNLTLGTFFIAFFHFFNEIFIFKTTNLSTPGTLSPTIVSSISIIAMLSQYSFYVS